MNALRINYRPEDEQHGELFGVVDSEGFRGHGSAWFKFEQLRDFCTLLGSYPIGDEGLSLAGGYWDDEGNSLEQCHLGVSLSPRDRLGSVQVMVTLANPGQENEASERHRSVRARFLVSYMDIDRFRTAFEAMLDGRAEDAVLEATAS